MKTEVNWHARFTQQAGWTRSLRSHLYQAAGLRKASLVLEVGCGTGAILQDLPQFTQAGMHGLDLDPTRLREAARHVPTACFVNGNALSLPYPPGVFDVTLCHFLLLWVADPLQVLREMKRVTRQGGALLVLAEPDYSQRIDQPQTLARLGELQTRSLQLQGADPALGAKLSALFSMAEIKLMEAGTLKRMKETRLEAQDWELEWSVLESDLEGLLPASEIAAFKQVDLQTRLNGERTLYVPTHYAWGRV
jgi:SAM-dependent methyltransferase